jgi:hypothetical protein
LHISEYQQETGTMALKTDHKFRYYDQVQGQLHIGGFAACDFVVKTNVDATIVRIYRDPEWVANIQKLIDFFFQKLLPHIEDNSNLSL